MAIISPIPPTFSVLSHKYIGAARTSKASATIIAAASAATSPPRADRHRRVAGVLLQRPHQDARWDLQHDWCDIWLIKLAGISTFLIAYSPSTGPGCDDDAAEL